MVEIGANLTQVLVLVVCLAVTAYMDKSCRDQILSVVLMKGESRWTRTRNGTESSQ